MTVCYALISQHAKCFTVSFNHHNIFYEGHDFPHFMGQLTEVQKIYDISMDIMRMDELGRLCRKEKKVQRIDWWLAETGGTDWAKWVKVVKDRNFQV